MIEDLIQERTGVICLHCRMHTPLPKPAKQAGNDNAFRGSSPEIAIVRCRKCGKEAPYLAHEIVIFKEPQTTAYFAA
ncbi:MAG TPA: hypothetical protein VGT24_08720 [Candidatus Acidoferrales bacterium]|nr:hypothetical protein [Candidatus Acidoferrales bacterium]